MQLRMSYKSVRYCEIMSDMSRRDLPFLNLYQGLHLCHVVQELNPPSWMDQKRSHEE